MTRTRFDSLVYLFVLQTRVYTCTGNGTHAVVLVRQIWS